MGPGRGAKPGEAFGGDAAQLPRALSGRRGRRFRRPLPRNCTRRPAAARRQRRARRRFTSLRSLGTVAAGTTRPRPLHPTRTPMATVSANYGLDINLVDFHVMVDGDASFSSTYVRVVYDGGTTRATFTGSGITVPRCSNRTTIWFGSGER